MFDAVWFISGLLLGAGLLAVFTARALDKRAAAYDESVKEIRERALKHSQEGWDEAKKLAADKHVLVVENTVLNRRLAMIRQALYMELPNE